MHTSGTPTTETAHAGDAGSDVLLEWSSQWRLDGDDGEGVVVSAGADRVLRLEGIDDALRRCVVRWSAGGPVVVKAPQRRLADQLVALGALVATPDVGHLGVAGDPIFTEKLAAAMEVTPHVGGLVLLVRTTDQWPAAPDGAHLAVDCSMHHTLVLGPYVVPGLTACTRCLTTRMARRWQPAPVPAHPAIQLRLHVVAELVGIQVELIRQGRSPLVNATIAWDLEQGTTDQQTLLKTPGCPTCDRGENPGNVSLPWADASISTGVTQ